VFPVLYEGVCPLYLPIWVSSRELLIEKLNAHNIESFVFGKYPHPRMNPYAFPEAASMRDLILCLPLHQYMDESQLNRLVDVLGPLLKHHDATEAADCSLQN
jgi:dTDP-4-amino-4,6-dideoxygalactose transaminase